jgi:hypothetical protein
MTLFRFPGYAVSEWSHSVRMYVTNWLCVQAWSPNHRLRSLDACQSFGNGFLGAMKIEPKKTLPVLGIEAHREDRLPSASG